MEDGNRLNAPINLEHDLKRCAVECAQRILWDVLGQGAWMASRRCGVVAHQYVAVRRAPFELAPMVAQLPERS